MVAPWPILTTPGFEIVKLGAYTVRVSVVLAVSVPEVPVMVTVFGPIAAVLAAVNVTLLEFVVGFCENDAVTPLGKPETERFTLPVKPYAGLMDT